MGNNNVLTRIVAALFLLLAPLAAQSMVVVTTTAATEVVFDVSHYEEVAPWGPSLSGVAHYFTGWRWVEDSEMFVEVTYWTWPGQVRQPAGDAVISVTPFYP